MPVSGNYGTPGNPQETWSSYWQLQWYTGSDPAHVEGDFWGRSDLDNGGKIATLRFDNGSNVDNIPVFSTATDASSSDIKEVARVPTPNGRGWMPVLEGGGTYNYLAYIHGSTRHGVHDGVNVIPDTGLLHNYDYQREVFNDGASVGTLTDREGTKDLTGNSTYRYSGVNSTESGEYDGANDAHTASEANQNSEYTFAIVFQYISATSDNYLIYNGDGSSGYRLGITSGNFNLSHSGVASNGWTAADTNPHVAVAAYDGSTLFVDFDGAEVINTSVGYNDPSGTLGVGTDPFDNYGNAYIGQVLLYGEYYDGSSRDDLTNSLQDRWGF